MISNQSIVCIPLTTWDNSFTNTIVKMMTILSKNNKVLFVDYQYTYKDILTTLRGKKNAPVKRMLGIEERLRTVTTIYGTQVHVLTPPPVIPVNWITQPESYRFFLRVNGGLIKGSIQKAIKELKMDNPIVVNGYNSFFGLPLAGAFNEKLNIYYCYDEIKGDIWYNFHGPKVEEDYMRKADMVITTSEALLQSKCGINPQCYVVKNGVDFDLFNKAINISMPEKKRKVVGYTGSVDERFDTELMTYVIQNLPEVDFVFVGRSPNETARKAIAKFPNVKLIGSKKPEEIPSFVAEIDLGIIPYLKNEVTRGVYPLKINEYLAVGKPVVMTDFAPLPEFNELVCFASTKEAFLNFVKEELNNDSDVKRDKRIQMARENSWERRVDEFSDLVERRIIDKKRKSA